MEQTLKNRSEPLIQSAGPSTQREKEALLRGKGLGAYALKWPQEAAVPDWARMPGPETQADLEAAAEELEDAKVLEQGLEDNPVSLDVPTQSDVPIQGEPHGPPLYEHAFDAGAGKPIRDLCRDSPGSGLSAGLAHKAAEGAGHLHDTGKKAKGPSGA